MSGLHAALIFRASPDAPPVPSFPPLLSLLTLPSPPPPLLPAGFNRTGFTLCSYLVQVLGLAVDDALSAFNEARPPGVKHEDFVRELRRRYDAVQLPGGSSGCDEECSSSNNGGVGSGGTDAVRRLGNELGSRLVLARGEEGEQGGAHSEVERRGAARPSASHVRVGDGAADVWESGGRLEERCAAARDPAYALSPLNVSHSSASSPTGNQPLQPSPPGGSGRGRPPSGPSRPGGVTGPTGSGGLPSPSSPNCTPLSRVKSSGLTGSLVSENESLGLSERAILQGFRLEGP